SARSQRGARPRSAWTPRPASASRAVVIRRLRAWLDRPIVEEHPGRRLALALLVVAALGALAVARHTGEQKSAAPPRRPTATRRVAPARSPGAARHREAPAPRGPTVRAPDPAAASAARRFLTGYLRFLYGRDRRPHLSDASAGLERQLAHERTRP